MFKKLTLIMMILISIFNIKSDSVCDLETLKLELLQDLDDNNMLDCLRLIEVPHNFDESEEQKNKRLAAQWDTSCSFEADSVWFDNLKKYYGVTQLVDSVGDPVKIDFAEQADMCELVRAAVAKNLFEIKNLDMQNLPKSFIDKIQCSGPKGDIYGPQICAATSGSFFSKSSWNVLNKSAAIKFDNKPQFTEKETSGKDKNNPWADNDNVPESVNDLDLLSKDQLDSAGGDIAQIINNALKGKPMNFKDGVDPSNNNPADGEFNSQSSEKVHHYFKRTNSQISIEREFRLMDNGEIRFNSEGSKILMGVFMASYNMQEYGQFCLKMNLNDFEVPESRQCIGSFRRSSISGAFAEKYTSDQTKISLLALSTGSGEIQSDGENMNLHFGAITFPDLGIYKHRLGMDTINIPATGNLFSPVENFSMGINHASEKPGMYLIIANFSLKLPEGSYFGALITLNSKELLDTTLVRGKSSSVGINSTTVVELFPGNNQLGLKYMYVGNNNIELTSSKEEGRYNQSIVAFQLPPSTKVNNFKANGPVNLATNSWMSFNLNAKLDLQNETHVMILYHLHIKVAGSPFSARLKVNGNKSFQSTVAHVEDEDFASVQGYLVKLLKPGQYEFDIEFLTKSQEQFDPASEPVDKQTVSIKLIEFQ